MRYLSPRHPTCMAILFLAVSCGQTPGFKTIENQNSADATAASDTGPHSVSDRGIIANKAGSVGTTPQGASGQGGAVDHGSSGDDPSSQGQTNADNGDHGKNNGGIPVDSNGDALNPSALFPADPKANGGTSSQGPGGGGKTNPDINSTSGNMPNGGTSTGGTSSGTSAGGGDGSIEKTALVCIAFEDYKDFDYNDAMLRLTGNFFVKDRQVISSRDQTVIADAFHASACNHRIDITITDLDGTVHHFAYSSAGTKNVPLSFKLGSRLGVKLTPTAGVCKHVATLDDTVYSRLTLGVCNFTGN